MSKVLLLSVLIAAVSANPLLEAKAGTFRSGRVVGGVNAPESGIPYQLSLRNALSIHFCGGSIISELWVLTAAHCTVGRNPMHINALAGTNLLNSGGTSHRGDLIRNHPSYNANTLANDVSVLRVQTPFVSSARVSVIALSAVATGGNVQAVLTGWGQISEPGATPNHLQWIQLGTLTNAECRSRFSATNANRVFDHKICTVGPIGQGACRGDSGGPLVASNAQIGIVSWGIPCALGSPDVYDRVSSHRTWILNNSQ